MGLGFDLSGLGSPAPSLPALVERSSSTLETLFSVASAASTQSLDLVRQDGSQPVFTLLASQAMTAGSLSLSLPELLLSHQRKFKVSPFTGIISVPPSEAFPQVSVAATDKVDLCGGFAPELAVGFALDSSLAVLVRLGAPNGCVSPNPLSSSTDSVLVVASALAPVVSSSKIFEASTSSSHSVWNFGFDSVEEDGIDWVEEGDDFP